MEGTATSKNTEKRIAVVTGGNKGIGLEICKQLASSGFRVILTARDEKRGMEAVEKLKISGLSDVIFHQLDVTDSSSIGTLADFISTKFGKLDILVNNAAVGGIAVDPEILKTINAEKVGDFSWLRTNVQETFELAETCLKTNYYGVKDVTKALIPLIQSSYSGKIVNISSLLAQSKYLSSDKLKRAIYDIDDMSEERLDEMSRSFLQDFKQGLLDANGWPTSMSAYTVSKVLVNAYTRILAKKNQNICINPVNPGFVKTDINYNIGPLSVEEGAKGPVMVALKPDNSSTGLLFDQTEVSSF